MRSLMGYLTDNCCREDADDEGRFWTRVGLDWCQEVAFRERRQDLER
jgi:hypothetical protein